MLQQLNPAHTNFRQPYLTQDEYDKYIKEFKTTE